MRTVKDCKIGPVRNSLSRVARIGREGVCVAGGVLDAFGLLSVQQHHSAVQSLILGTATPVDHRPSAGRVKLEFRD